MAEVVLLPRRLREPWDSHPSPPHQSPVRRERPREDLELLELWFAGFNLQEIAQILGISHEAARQRWFRLKGWLLGHIDRPRGDDSGGNSRPEKEER